MSDKQTLFISYCWKDGSAYADELETQLQKDFDVKRDKSQLIVNDDMYDFMAGIASCDNVVIVLTKEYVKSLNCMLEMAYLVKQEDWSSKSMVLVIDDTLYGIDRKFEVIHYWENERKSLTEKYDAENIGRAILSEEKEYLDLICSQIEDFVKGLSRRKNPSQIAIVSEIIKKSQDRHLEIEKEKELQLTISKGENAVLSFLEKRGSTTLAELSTELQMSKASASRYIRELLNSGKIERQGTDRTLTYTRIEQ